MILCTCGGLLLGSGAHRSAQAGVFSLDHFLPNAVTSFDDLDVRDEANRQIQSITAINDLKDLFQAGVFNLLVQAELPSVARALSIIEQKLNLAGHSLARALPKACQQFLAAILAGPRQWDKMLTRLCTLPGINLLVVGLSFSTLLFVRAARTGTLFVFRC